MPSADEIRSEIERLEGVAQRQAAMHATGEYATTVGKLAGLRWVLGVGRTPSAPAPTTRVVGWGLSTPIPDPDSGPTVRWGGDRLDAETVRRMRLGLGEPDYDADGW
jgi:hypothetical protein